MQNRNRGFTLIEMMIVVAVMSIILAMAVPSFRQAIENARLSTQVNEFATALTTARTEAIRTGGSVWLTAKDDDFNNGWCVRTSSDDCGTDDPADLLDHPALDTQLVLSYPAAPETSSFAFNRLGALVTPGDATVIEIAPKGCEPGRAKRRIDINAIGRISIERDDC